MSAPDPLSSSEAISGQSANIEVVSGASYTSPGFRTPLQSALDAAHFGWVQTDIQTAGEALRPAVTEETQNEAGQAERMNRTGGSQVTRPAQPRLSVLLRTDGSKPRVLVVDDEADLTRAVVAALIHDGWDAQGVTTGRAAVTAAADWPPDLVVLDVMLPDINGFDVLAQLRAEAPAICVLFLTARDSVQDRVWGITVGADDYVTKPFSIEELVARARGLIRRAGLARSATDSRLQVGDLSMDEDAREVQRADVAIDLTGTEFELLRYLMQNPRRVLSKEQILDNVWEYDFGGNSHVVELYISYLRKKIDVGRLPMIHTVRGFGYVLKPSQE